MHRITTIRVLRPSQLPTTSLPSPSSLSPLLSMLHSLYLITSFMTYRVWCHGCPFASRDATCSSINVLVAGRGDGNTNTTTTGICIPVSSLYATWAGFLFVSVPSKYSWVSPLSARGLSSVGVFVSGDCETRMISEM
jgi:hypothetical protein